MMKNLTCKATLLLLLISAVSSLTIGTLSCCPKTYVYDMDTLTCVCPPTAPYKNAAGQCLPCDAPATWNATTLLCQKCRPEQS